MKKPNKSKLLALLALFGLGVGLASCSKQHVHVYHFDYDETYHQGKCDFCEQTLEKEEHSISNLTDACTTCPYVDPVFTVNDNGIMTGLTAHGKGKAMINIPSNVKFLGSKSFYGSSAISVYLPRTVLGIYEDAFEGKANINIVTEEDYVQWTYKDGIYYKQDLMAENEAYYNGKFFKTLKEAISAVEDQDVKITLLRENVTCDSLIQVSYDITIDTYVASSTLKADFKILSSGSVTIDENVHLEGQTELPLSQFDDFGRGCFTSGSLLFRGLEVAPNDIEVKYSIKDKTYPAIGAKQIANKLLVIPQTYYAYGTCKYSEDLTLVQGLTRFGSTVKNLTITAASPDIPAKIADGGFVYRNAVSVGALGITITIEMYSFKGAFNEITIGEGITEIGAEAFATRIDNDLNMEMKDKIGPLVSPLKKVTIGDSCKIVRHNAFMECLSLEVVKTGKALEFIDEWAFHVCLKLTNVNMSESLNLKTIKGNAFVSDINLGSVVLPTRVGWKIGNTVMNEDQLDEASAASYLIHGKYNNADWNRLVDAEFVVFHPEQKDDKGRYINIAYYSSLNAAIQATTGDFVIRTTSLYKEQAEDCVVDRNVTLETHSKETKLYIGNMEIKNEASVIINSSLVLSGQITIKMQDDGKGTLSSNSGLLLPKAVNPDGDKLNVKFDTFAAKAEESKMPTGRNRIPFYGYGLTSFAYKPAEEKVEIKGATSVAKDLDTLRLGCPFKGMRLSETTIVDGAFKVNVAPSKLAFVICDATVRHIPDGCFNGCTNLYTVELGENIEDIGNHAFYGCVNLRNCVAPNPLGFKAVGTGAFENCVKLQDFMVAGVSTFFWYIGAGAFKGSGLNFFCFPNLKDWKAGNTLVSWKDLQDMEKAATLLKTTYCEVEWRRQDS